MNTPIEHTEHRTDSDPLQGTGAAFARFGPRRVPDPAATVDTPWTDPEGEAEG